MILRSNRKLQNFLIALPLLSLLIGLIAWLRYGMDLPWVDDWRGYADGNIDSLSLRYLFRAVNDTLCPVGFALDALAQRYLGGNSIAYQFLSMLVVLGGLLLLQWKLLLKFLENRFQAAVCFVFTLLMLQPDSYWGYENLAYAQALPLVFMLAALMLIFSEGRWWHGLLIFVLGLLAGFSYISGAIALLASSLVLCMCFIALPTMKAQPGMLRKGLWYMAAGWISAAAQVWFAVIGLRNTYKGLLPPLALPDDSQFWWYLLGKVGRSVMLPVNGGWTSALVALLASAIVLGATTFVLVRMRNPALSLADARFFAIYMAMLSMIGTYLATVSAGRANYALQEVTDGLGIFFFGFLRFHFFWVTLIWPWVMAVLLRLFCNQEAGHRPMADWIGLGVAVAATVWIVQAGGMAHMRSQEANAQLRESAMHCLLDDVQTGKGIHCLGLRPAGVDGALPDSAAAYAYARKIGASFVRYVPVLPVHGKEEYAQAFSLYDGHSDESIGLNQMKGLGQGQFHVLGDDPWMRMDAGHEPLLRSCLQLDVDVEVKVDSPEPVAAQFFYRAPGEADFSAKNSQTRTIAEKNNDFQKLRFQLSSQRGFDSSIRFDPVNQMRDVAIRGMVARCRVSG
jgi:hypothetical protein